MTMETEKPCLIRRVEGTSSDRDEWFFGKRFPPTPSGSHPIILVHTDYPMVTENLIRLFEAEVRGRPHVVVTGSSVFVHPYRLMKLDINGHQRYLFDIKNEIRGNRHLYPKIVSFRPALVYLPAGVSFEEYARSVCKQGELPELYPMAQGVLLDHTIFLEALLIRALSREDRSVRVS